MTQGQDALLGVMIAAAVTIWAIGVAIYQFIYKHFADRHLDRARAMARNPASWTSEELREMRCRLLRNYWVFGGYLVAGVLTAISVYCSGITLANESPETLGIAYTFFAAVVGSHLALFSFEFFTSMSQVGELADQIGDP